ncbi:MAG: hypothetical protein CSB44_05985 [Gammaproteobacteria bacterium]|nr:MAG: hypothetical protein CSB44_05985 [Gammaproteobacteria bacterium]PIE36084.1 MAG: hypothetical protein CSA54_04955 [Gammaproteobacteria bacterium]
MTVTILTLVVLLSTHTALADKAHVIDAHITDLGGGRYRIDATIEHADEGWEHYANAFEVYAEDGTLLGTRELAHPHVNEQPFTRSLTLELPPGTGKVEIRAVDSVHGEGGKVIVLALPASK